MKKEENAKYDRYTDSVDTEFGRIEKAYIDYPPFTAEKQLELIKLFAKRAVYINSQENKYYIFTMNIGGSTFGENLENALARYINKVWQDLT